MKTEFHLLLSSLLKFLYVTKKRNLPWNCILWLLNQLRIKFMDRKYTLNTSYKNLKHMLWNDRDIDAWKIRILSKQNINLSTIYFLFWCHAFCRIDVFYMRFIFFCSVLEISYYCIWYSVCRNKKIDHSYNLILLWSMEYSIWEFDLELFKQTTTKEMLILFLFVELF